MATGHTQNDYMISVPLELLMQIRAEKRNRQLILGIIAGVSLVVAGIGIMNIMLATVTERTREIGIRRALGAKQRHIAQQFLVETLVLTMAGGALGVASGSAGAFVLTKLAHWPTIITVWSVLISVSVAGLVGIFFGMYPALAAARLDPIEALRHE
jgi:putative ABC transport system permease protein